MIFGGRIRTVFSTRDAIERYARSQNFAMKGVFTMDGSKRSSKTNAFFTGFGRNKRIALYDTLVAGHGVRELVAVLATVQEIDTAIVDGNQSVLEPPTARFEVLPKALRVLVP